MDYCTSHGITTTELQRRMRGKSAAWDRLLPHWDELIALLQQEIATGTGSARRTYLAMKCALDDGTPCGTCNGTGRGVECNRCKGTGRRSGGRCRAPHCYGGADSCRSCRGRGYFTAEVPA